MEPSYKFAHMFSEFIRLNHKGNILVHRLPVPGTYMAAWRWQRLAKLQHNHISFHFTDTDGSVRSREPEAAESNSAPSALRVFSFVVTFSQSYRRRFVLAALRNGMILRLPRNFVEPQSVGVDADDEGAQA